MLNEVRYTNIRRVLDNLTDHPMLRDLTLEQVVRYTLRFIAIHGYPCLYKDKIEVVDIEDFRGELPCDLISIIQVRDCVSKLCMRSMTDNFTPGLREHHPHMERRERGEGVNTFNKSEQWHNQYIPPMRLPHGEPTFKTQGRIIFTSFPHGAVEIAYKAIPVDEDGFPLLIDNELYLGALEAYIKKQVFTVKFDQQKIPAGVLQNAQQEYAWLAGQLREEFETPSVSQMESIVRMWETILPNVRAFDNGFKDMGNREYLVNH